MHLKKTNKTEFRGKKLIKLEGLNLLCLGFENNVPYDEALTSFFHFNIQSDVLYAEFNPEINQDSKINFIQLFMFPQEVQI